jgi:hypothetical protein
VFVETEDVIVDGEFAICAALVVPGRSVAEDGGNEAAGVALDDPSLAQCTPYGAIKRSRKASAVILNKAAQVRSGSLVLRPCSVYEKKNMYAAL